MTTIKIYLPNDEIRRFSYDVEKLSYESLINLLASTISNFHPEMRIHYLDQENDKILVTSEVEFQEMISHLTQLQQGKLSLIKIWISDSNKPLFRDGSVELLHAYDEEKKIDSFEKSRQESILLAISRLFPDNKILPYHIPSFLQNVLSVKTTGHSEAEVDIKVGDLFKAINTAALDLLDSTEQYALNKAKTLFESLQILEPTNPNVYYNLACVESLSKNVKASVDFLRIAFQHGYNNIEHMCEDLDLTYLKTVMQSQDKWEEFVQSMKAMLHTKKDDCPVVVPIEKCEVIVEQKAEDQMKIELKVEEKATSEQIKPAEEQQQPQEPKEPQEPQEPQQPHPSQVKSQHMYAEQIEKIKEMGFQLAESTIEIILEHHNGKLENALAELY
jgi:hypothetical protein